MNAWYNEPDPFAASWLESLISHGHTADGVVYRQPIQRVRTSDLIHFQQFHFFAGIGGWSYALRLAGWPDTLPVWTGSCPCQPFSNAGSKRGTLDDRHLWPYFRNLIRDHLPTVVFGEQVASPLGRSWLASVRSDLERLGYEVGCADLCAASVGAPHIRQRLYWVADRLEHADDPRPQRRFECKYSAGERVAGQTGVDADWLGNTNSEGTRQHSRSVSVHESKYGFRWPNRSHSPVAAGSAPDGVGSVSGIEPTSACDVWSEVEYVALSDRTLRPIKPGIFPLADGTPERVGRLCGYGNAIVPQLAAEFVKAYMDVRGIRGRT